MSFWGFTSHKSLAAHSRFHCTDQNTGDGVLCCHFKNTRNLWFCALHNWFCNFKLIGRSPPSCVKKTGVEGSLSPANTIHCPIVGSMLGQCRRQ